VPVGVIHREVGQSIFGTDAAGYDAGRLAYPAALFDLLHARCGLTAGARLFEVGPGTGQATRELLDRGADVTAIEPDSALIDVLKDAGRNRSGALRIVNSAFESSDIPEGVFDLGVAATSFGWVEKDAAYARIRQLLRPGGWWAMWWNIFHDVRGDPIFDRTMLGVTRPAAFTGAAHYSLDQAERLFELGNAGLIDAEYSTIERSVVMTPASLRALYSTLSPLRRLPPEEMARRLDWAEGQAEAEAIDGVIERMFMTTVYIARNP
jgi:SAM-dependent methyltransferase